MTTSARRLAASAQRGVSMLFALCALAVLTIGAVALVRSVDTGMLVLGNLGFKKDAVAAGSLTAESAITWLQNSTAVSGMLDSDIPANGYSSTAPANLDPTGSLVATSATAVVVPDWKGDDCQSVSAKTTPVCLKTQALDADGNSRYVITRLCKNAGPNDSSNSCVTPVTAQTTTTHQRGALKPGGRFTTFSTGTAYRILTRTVGARGTVAYTETLVHF
ncbi:hypothetical protein [Pelomonas sp. KK5]|uniref:pilus assembly PilX family protein n=1 Tax=Pelomonas sp. KK5 TaxID=1855730 RepID=UPI00117F9939|nr:hypothetical protein [Pelomonas sp. KK5]